MSVLLHMVMEWRKQGPVLWYFHQNWANLGEECMGNVGDPRMVIVFTNQLKIYPSQENQMHLFSQEIN